RKAPLQLRDQIRRLRDVKGAGSDEQDVIGADHAVFRVHGRAFDDRQDVALHALAAHVGPVRALAACNLVDLVDEDDAGLLHPLDRRAGDAVHVDQLLLFLRAEVFERLGHLQLAPLALALKEPRQHVLDVDVDFLDLRPGNDLEGWKRLLPYVDFDDAMVEAAGAQLIAEVLARAVRLVVRRRRRIGGGRTGGAMLAEADRWRWRQQDVEQPLFGILARLRAHFLEPFLAHHVDAQLDEVADHRLDVAADVADLGELRRLDLDERRLCEPRQAARDLGLADAGRADHQDVLRRDLLGELGRELLSPHPVAQRDRDRPLGRRLTDDVLVQLRDDLARRQGAGARLRGFGKIYSHYNSSTTT